MTTETILGAASVGRCCVDGTFRSDVVIFEIYLCCSGRSAVTFKVDAATSMWAPIPTPVQVWAQPVDPFTRHGVITEIQIDACSHLGLKDDIIARRVRLPGTYHPYQHRYQAWTEPVPEIRIFSRWSRYKNPVGAPVQFVLRRLYDLTILAWMPSSRPTEYGHMAGSRGGDCGISGNPSKTGS